MARKKKSRQDELFELLRARGLRKRAARTLAAAGNKADSPALRGALDDLKSLVSEIEGRVTGGGESAKRKAAAEKAAATRKREAAKRSAAARKAAKTRASGSSSSRSTSSRSGSSRSSGGTSRTRSSRSRSSSS